MSRSEYWPVQGECEIDGNRPGKPGHTRAEGDTDDQPEPRSAEALREVLDRHKPGPLAEDQNDEDLSEEDDAPAGGWAYAGPKGAARRALAARQRDGGGAPASTAPEPIEPPASTPPEQPAWAKQPEQPAMATQDKPLDLAQGKSGEKYGFGSEYQDAILACILRHPEKFLRYAGVLNAAYFSGVSRICAARAIFKYYAKWGKFPNWAVAGSEIYDAIERSSESKDEEAIMAYVKKLEATDTSDVEAIAEAVVQFARHRAHWIAFDEGMKFYQEGKEPPGGFARLFEAAAKIGTSTAGGESLEASSQLAIDEKANLLGNRWMSRQDWCALVGPSGIGKSSAAYQMMACWSCGREAFGIAPARPLSILCVQAENNPGDMIETCRGILGGLQLTPEERKLVHQNTLWTRVNDRSGTDFLDKSLRPLLSARKWDLVYLDPLGPYLGGDPSDAKVVTEWASGFQTLLQRFDIGGLTNMHTGKLTNRDTTGWRPIEWAYAACGSSLLTNVPRAILVIDPTHDPRAFRFIAAKHGNRLGWRDATDKPAWNRYFIHSRDPEKIIWDTPDADEVEMIEAKLSNAAAEKQHSRYAARRLYADDLWIKPLPFETEDPMPHAEWLEKTLALSRLEGHEMSKPAFERRRGLLLRSGAVCKTDDGYFRSSASSNKLIRAMEEETCSAPR